MNILGIGELTIDFIYLDGNIQKIQGGGTAHNVIYNLTNTENKLYIGGVSGDDIYSELELKKITTYGINTSLVKKKSKKTRKVFTYITKNSFGNKDTLNSVKCPKCEKDTWTSTSSYNITEEDLLINNINLVIFDSYKKENLNIATMCIKNKIKTVLDWGVIGNLRYLSEDKLINLKENPFEIIQINGRVAKFLKTRLKISSDIELYNFLNVELLVITHGKEGSNIIYTDHLSIYENHIKFDVENKVDNNGAGDAFLSAVLETYINFFNNKNDFILELKNSAKERVNKALITIGARFDYKPLEFDKLSMDNLSSDICNLCFSNTKKKIKERRKFKLIIATEKISYRLEHGLSLRFMEECKQFIANLEDNLLIVGQGASFVAGEYVARIIEHQMPIFVKTVYSNEIDNINLNLYKNVLILSSSGTSPDTKKIITKIKNYNFKKSIMTARESLDYEGINVISYHSQARTREQGFISIESIILPVSGLLVAASSLRKQQLIDIQAEISNNFLGFDYNFSKNNNCIDIFYSYAMKPVAIDMESKFVESGLARPLLHEKKNYSHGRFSITKHNKCDQAIYIDSVDKYDDILKEYLLKKDVQIININSKTQEFSTKIFELMILMQYIFNDIGVKVDIDLSDPGYDKDDAKIYKYK